MRADRWFCALACALALIGAGRDGLSHWVMRTDLPPVVSETSVELRDRNHAALRIYTVTDGLWRLDVRTDQVDPDYLKMLIAYEDSRFYQHAGVDPRALIRAVAQALWHGEIVSGGSTLTMQVARLLEDGGTGRWRGKLRQIRVALALERRLTKDQILQLYLTHAPFGGNLEGVRAATLSWFGKAPARLTPAEAALLVALPQAPEARRPDRAPDAASRARDRVLSRMQNAGVLDAAAALAARSEPVPTARRPFPALAPHLADRARAEAPERLRHDLTLDASLQRALERLAAEAVRRQPEGVSVAMVVADHRSGEILASVGSAGYADAAKRQGFVDMTRAKRSPGSTLKPLIYAMAFDRGLAHPETLINDRPVAFGTYAPQNFDGVFRGELRVAEALRQSLNIPVILLLNEIGPAHLLSVLRRAGTQPVLSGDHAGLAVGLGGVGLSLTELVQTYAMLAQGGRARDLVWRLGADGPVGERVVSQASAWHVGDILSSTPPPLARPPAQLPIRPAPLMGTAMPGRWALTVGMWLAFGSGGPDGTPVPGAFGGDVAAPVLFEAFQRIKRSPDPLPPPPPEALIVTTAALPAPLQRFQGREAVFGAAPDAPKLIFPPEGAQLILEDGLPAKVRDGTPPFTWLANGAPVMTGAQRREVVLPAPSEGYSTLTVIDAAGRAARVQIELK